VYQKPDLLLIILSSLLFGSSVLLLDFFSVIFRLSRLFNIHMEHSDFIHKAEIELPDINFINQTGKQVSTTFSTILLLFLISTCELQLIQGSKL